MEKNRKEDQKNDTKKTAGISKLIFGVGAIGLILQYGVMDTPLSLTGSKETFTGFRKPSQETPNKKNDVFVRYALQMQIKALVIAQEYSGSVKNYNHVIKSEYSVDRFDRFALKEIGAVVGGLASTYGSSLLLARTDWGGAALAPSFIGSFYASGSFSRNTKKTVTLEDVAGSEKQINDFANEIANHLVTVLDLSAIEEMHLRRSLKQTIYNNLKKGISIQELFHELAKQYNKSTKQESSRLAVYNRVIEEIDGIERIGSLKKEDASLEKITPMEAYTSTVRLLDAVEKLLKSRKSSLIRIHEQTKEKGFGAMSDLHELVAQQLKITTEKESEIGQIKKSLSSVHKVITNIDE